MLINKMEKIEETFKHIRDNWKEEYYQTCELEWKNIISFISTEPTPYKCPNCNTFWTKGYFIENITYNICPNCDTHCQPFLCNPINYSYVLQYIDPKFHHYLILNRFNNENIAHSIFLNVPNESF